MTLSGLGYICSAGETFDMIALNVYGDEKYSAELLNANPERDTVTVFKGGETLYLPVVYVPPVTDEEYAPVSAPWR